MAKETGGANGARSKDPYVGLPGDLDFSKIDPYTSRVTAPDSELTKSSYVSGVFNSALVSVSFTGSSGVGAFGAMTPRL